jgi:rhodanese-related sulfurtransferase
MLAFLLENWVLLLAALTSGGLLLWPHLQGGGGSSSVSVSEAVRLMNREKGVLIDVSSAEEFAAGHANGARHIAWDQLQSQGATASGLPSNKSLPVLLMCARGARSARAAQTLRKAGFERVFSVQGGMQAWKDAQLPTTRS